jgi:alkylation response protein AidB-like acyl-CoA dehydrogenase
MRTGYQPPDYYNCDELFTEEELLARDSVRDFVTDKIVPIIGKHWGDGTFPTELVPEMGELGLFGANLHGYGCAGVSHTAYGLMMQELERGDSGVRSFVSVQGALCMYPIYAHGSDAQKDRWLPAMAKGEAIGCFGLTEPDFGSNPTGMLTRARRDGDSWILNGRKRWITNAQNCHVAIVWAKDDDGMVRGFLVENGTPGLEVQEVAEKMSLRASATGELILEDVRIPADNVLPNVQGMRGPLSCLNQARYGIAWGAVGAAQAVFDEARSYALDRIQFGSPIARFQLVQAKLAQMLTDITAAQLICARLGRLKEAGTMRHQHVSLAKRNNVKIALDAARNARDILGANGITLEYGAGRHMCNLETVSTYEGTHDIHTLILGADITGLPAFTATDEPAPT